MPRNGSGVYTLPQAAFVPNTTISSSAVNSDFSDIATALTGSVSADGQTPLTGTIKFLTGTSSAPSITFSSDTTSGLYSVSTGELGLVANAFGIIVNGNASAAASAIVANGGSGYAVGDQITLTGGVTINPVVLQVATISGSAVATVTIVEAGRYISQPANPVPQGSTTGGGTLATFTVTWNTVEAVTDLSSASLWQALGGTAFFKNNIVSANSLTSLLGSGSVSAYNLAASALTANLTMINGTIVQTQSGGAQTFSIQNQSGNVPTSINPVYLIFRSATAATANYTVISITSALSITIPSGQAMGFSNSVPARIWIGAYNNSGTAGLIVLNALTYTNVTASGSSTTTSAGIFPLQGWGLISTSAVSGASSSGVAYSTTPQTNVPYVTLGYATWESGLGTAGSWGTLATRMQLFQPGTTPLPGQEIQRQYTGNPVQAAGSAGTLGTFVTPSGLSASITPTSAANPAEISGVLSIGCNPASSQVMTRFLRGTTAIGVGTVVGSRSAAMTETASVITSYGTSTSITYIDAPNSTSSQTYTWQISTASNYEINGSVTNSNNSNFGCDFSYIQVKELMG